MTPTMQMAPHDENAERILLGSILRENAVMHAVLEAVAAESFYRFAHQAIFRLMVELYDQRKPIDTVTLGMLFNDRKLFDDIGGPHYLADLWECVPNGAYHVMAADAVREKAQVRTLIHACNEILAEAYSQTRSVDELVAAAQRDILAIGSEVKRSDNVPLSVVVREVQQDIDRRIESKEKITGVPSGLIDLDELTGGFQAGELVIIAARPSVGKSAIVGNICRSAADYGLASLVFSLEMDRIQWGLRWICGEARVNSYAVRTGRLSHDQVQQIMAASDRLLPLPIWVNDTSGQCIRRIAAAARRLKSRHDVRLVVVDYLQLIARDEKRQTVNEQISQITQSLKNLARELSVPVLCLSQLSRDCEKGNRRPRLSDLRDSGAIEQDADTVIMLHRPGEQDKNAATEPIEAIVAKQRNGPCGDVTLVYRKATMRFENFAPEAMQ